MDGEEKREQAYMRFALFCFCRFIYGRSLLGERKRIAPCIDTID